MKKFIVFLILVIASVSATFILLHCFAPENSIDVSNSRFDSQKAEINGEIYYIKGDGVYKAAENQKYECLIAFDEPNTKAFFTRDKDCIYTAVNNDNSTSITKYDPDGNLTGKPFILDKSDVTVFSIDNNCIYSRYDNVNDENIAVFDMDGKMINNDLPEYEYSDDKFSFLGDKENTYYTSSNYIGRSKNYAAYIDKYYAPELTIIDLDSNDTVQIDLAAIFKAYYVYADIEDDSLCVVMTDTSKKISFGGGHSKELDISSLELNKYDIYALTDLKSGKITNQHKTRKYERIIYADTQKAITYYRGNYITYSTDNWKEVKSQKADEIKKDGNYFFDTCGDYIFVFDDDTGKLLNKISIE